MRIGASKNVGHGVRMYASKNVGGNSKNGGGCLTSVIAVLGVLAILSAFLGSGDKDSGNKAESDQEVRSVAEETQTEKAEDPEVLQIIEEPSVQEQTLAQEEPAVQEVVPLQETPTENTEPEKSLSEPAQEPVSTPQKQVAFVGSRESDKYHKPSCRFTKEILPENLIEWSSEEDAQACGYKPCGVCHP